MRRHRLDGRQRPLDIALDDRGHLPHARGGQQVGDVRVGIPGLLQNAPDLRPQPRSRDRRLGEAGESPVPLVRREEVLPPLAAPRGRQPRGLALWCN